MNANVKIPVINVYIHSLYQSHVCSYCLNSSHLPPNGSRIFITKESIYHSVLFDFMEVVANVFKNNLPLS